MFKSFRFLFQFAWVNLGAVLAFAAVVTVGSFATGVPNGAENLFETYFSTLPMVLLIILYILSFALCTSSMNLALSLGARRRDFFFAVQGILLLYTGVCWVLQTVVSAIPVVFHWARPERWSILAALRGPHPWSYPLLCLAVLCLGCVCGLIFARSRALGVLIITASAVLAMFGVIFLFVTSGTWEGSNPWGVLPVVLTAGAVAAVGVSEGFLWRSIQRYTVN